MKEISLSEQKFQCRPIPSKGTLFILRKYRFGWIWHLGEWRRENTIYKNETFTHTKTIFHENSLVQYEWKLE